MPEILAGHQPPWKIIFLLSHEDPQKVLNSTSLLQSCQKIGKLTGTAGWLVRMPVPQPDLGFVLGQRLSSPGTAYTVNERLRVCLTFQENVNSLLPVFEEFLKNAPNDASYDAVRQSVVVLMGSLAKHLDKSDPKVKPIVAKLIAALSTPSQQVPALWPGAPIMDGLRDA